MDEDSAHGSCQQKKMVQIQRATVFTCLLMTGKSRFSHHNTSNQTFLNYNEGKDVTLLQV